MKLPSFLAILLFGIICIGSAESTDVGTSIYTSSSNISVSSNSIISGFSSANYIDISADSFSINANPSAKITWNGKNVIAPPGGMPSRVNSDDLVEVNGEYHFRNAAPTATVLPAALPENNSTIALDNGNMTREKPNILELISGFFANIG